MRTALAGLVVLLLASCGSSHVSATRLTKDRTIDPGVLAREPTASQRPAVSAEQALAACRKDSMCDTKHRAKIELADVTSNNGVLRDQLAYILTWRSGPCRSAGPAPGTVSKSCTHVGLVDALTGRSAGGLDYSDPP
jgi:hypothetical protein